MKKLLFVLTAVFASTTVSKAAIFAYEGFDYTNGLAVNTNTLSGGTGWTNDWTANSGTTGTAWVTNSTGLTYSDGTSNLVVSSGSMFDNSSSGDGNRWRRNFAIPGGAWGTSETWFSFLTDRTDSSTTTTQPWTFRLQQDNNTLAQIRNISAATDGWEIANSGGAQQASTTAFSEVAAVFIVGRVTHVSGSDLLELWFNPNLTTPGTATISATFQDFSALNGFSFETGSTTTGRFDEIRFGTSFADVAPIPEPTTCALLAGSLTALMVFRRRHQR